MARPLDRTFSFNDNDEVSLSSDRQAQPHQFAQPYQDIPPRDMQVSPLPPHSSPPPREYTISPPSPPPHHNFPSSAGFPETQQRSLPSVSRRPLPPPIPTSYRENPFTHPEDITHPGRNRGHSSSAGTTSTTTPGMDNLGTSTAGGGIAGIALGVASTNERDSGLQAMRAIHDPNQHPANYPPERGYDSIGTDTPYIPEPPYRSKGLQPQDSYSSDASFVVYPNSSGVPTPQPYESDHGMQLDHYPQERRPTRQSSYRDNPYQGYSTVWDPTVGHGDFDPNDIADDGDDGMYVPQKRKSMLSLGKASDQSIPKSAMAGGAVAGGALGGLGGLVGRKSVGTGGPRGDSSGKYNPVFEPGVDASRQEKIDLLAKQHARRKKLRWIFGTLLLLAIIGIIVGAVVGVYEAGKRNATNTSSNSGQSAASDDGNGDLDKDSSEIKKLLGNSNLHKVFPGMDYTPFNAQYPDCLTNPPSQNNITRDMAVLSQLTNAVRLYGTDCNQTEMVLHSIDKLALTDMKIWLGVWLGSNDTTNDRQLSAMYDLLDKNGAKPFSGVIVGNEVLFRKDLTEDQLGSILSDVKSNLTSKKIDLPVATSELGSGFTAALAANVDIVMSNIHPFFAGVQAETAASWTWDFWKRFDLVLTQGTSKRNIIAETGWPSTGGKDCGEAPTCTDQTPGSIAGIDEMNKFMGDFVCQSLANNTEYFW